MSNWSSLSSEELAPLRVLNGVSPEAVEGLLDACPITTLEVGETLLEKGETNKELYVILSGIIRVIIDEDTTETPLILETGQTVGEMSVLDGKPTSAKVIATCFSRLLVVSEDKFWRLIDVSHRFAKNMLLLLAHRMRADDNFIRDSISLKNRLEEQTTIDPLTSLRNRRWLDDNFIKLIQRANFDKEIISFFMVDIDHFKGVNDTYGHLVGDEVLRDVSKVIRDSLRPGDFSCRFGGEEFAIILPNTSVEEARIPAERIRTKVQSVTAQLAVPDKYPAITISIGISSTSEKIKEVNEIIEAADENLYKAKESGRNRVVFN